MSSTVKEKLDCGAVPVKSTREGKKLYLVVVKERGKIFDLFMEENMLRHASSHGLSILFCTIISYIKPLFLPLTSLIEGFAMILADKINVPLDKDVIVIVLVASFLGLFWGLVFKLRFDD